jgi:hypothetical protein
MVVQAGFELTSPFHQISRRVCGLFRCNTGESLRAESFFASDSAEIGQRPRHGFAAKPRSYAEDLTCLGR